MPVDCIIIGAGLAGCQALHAIRQRGYSAKIIEAADDFGGVWHFNRYPGVAVDTEAPVYQLSDPKSWEGFNFSRRYPTGAELRAYFSHIAETLDLRKDTIFNQRVVEAAYDEESELWTFKTDKGWRETSRIAIFATGVSSVAYKPSFPGLSSFHGQIIHPSAWPEDLQLDKNMKIGIIGQGSTGVQILQEIAKLDAKVTVFVRTPAVAFPLRPRDISLEESEMTKCTIDALFQKGRDLGNPTGLPYNMTTLIYNDETEEQRLQRWEKLWARGSFAIFISNYKDFIGNSEMSSAFYNFWREKTRARITDPSKRRILVPREQPYHFYAKRPPFETDYFEMMDRDNVNIVDLKKHEIQTFIENGIITVSKDGTGKAVETLHELDLVILATGYDAITGSFLATNIRDKRGVLLQDKWKDGVLTHLGMMVPGMPNAFLLYGPQSPGPLANAPLFLEKQVDFICQLLDKAKAAGRGPLEVTVEAANTWRQNVQAISDKLFMGNSVSWFFGSNIPEKTNEPLVWFGGVDSWWNACMGMLDNWTGLHLHN